MSSKRVQPFLEAMIANLFWGFGFTATIWALESFTITQILFLRFAGVGSIGLIWALCKNPSLLKKFLPITLIPALFLLMEILFQVWGLQYTSATHAGFLTVTYIVMVPILEKFTFKSQIPRSHWFWVTLSIFGTALMVQMKEVSLNFGDLLMLVSALGASLHLLSVDRLGKAGSNLFFANTMQSLWNALLILPILFVRHESWSFERVSTASWLGIASLTFGSTMLAFYFQMRAQKTLSPSVSSLLFLIESPIAAAFGLTLLNETLTALQWIGCLLIVASAAGVIRNQLRNS